MIIICKKCKKKGSASFHDRPLKENEKTSLGHTHWRKIICNSCNYVDDEFEAILEDKVCEDEFEAILEDKVCETDAAIEFLTQVLGIDSIELQYINNLIKVVETKNFGDLLREGINFLRHPLGDINSRYLIFVIFERINIEVFNKIQYKIGNDLIKTSSKIEKEKLLQLCKKRIDTYFLPHIDASKSKFNNELDQVAVIGNTQDQIINEIMPILRMKVT